MRNVLICAALAGLATSAFGCALVAGYDFGKYGEREGAGGGATSSTSSGAEGGGSSVSSASGSTSTSAGGADGGATTAVLYSGSEAPSSIAVDEDAVYFTAKPTSTSLEGKVVRVTKDGSLTITLAAQELDPASICVDDTYVYWFAGATDHHIIKRALKKGGGTIEVVEDPNAGLFSLTSGAQALYYTTPLSDTVWIKPKSGGAATPLATNQPSPSDIVADASGVYWLNKSSATASDGAVMRADLDGSNPATLALGQKFPLRIATDASHVYWTTLSSGFTGVDKDGNNLFPYVVDGKVITGLAADGEHVYYTANNKLFRIPVGSLGPEQIPVQGEYPEELAVDETSVYVGVGRPNDPDLLLKIPK